MTRGETTDCEFLWPYPVLWFADHCGQDYLRFMMQMARARQPADIVGAEAAFTDHYLQDLMVVWQDLCRIPMRVCAAAARIDADQTAER